MLQVKKKLKNGFYNLLLFFESQFEAIEVKSTLVVFVLSCALGQ